VREDGGHEASCTIVTEQSQTVKAPGCGAPMINADGHGYYFTEYEPAAVAALAHRDSSARLRPAAASGLLGDEMAHRPAPVRHDIETYSRSRCLRSRAIRRPQVAGRDREPAVDTCRTRLDRGLPSQQPATSMRG
jgi:hypothetical protein